MATDPPADPAWPPPARFDFRRGAQGWTSVDDGFQLRGTPEGLAAVSRADGAALTSPALTLPAGAVAWVTLVARRTGGDPFATLEFGPGFRSDDARFFLLPATGAWETVVVALPVPPGANRLRLRPLEGRGSIVLRSLSIAWAHREPAGLWADPVALRDKEIVAAGQWLVDGTFSARWLASQPDFTARFPYNGMVLPLRLSRADLAGTGIDADHAFAHDVLWTTIPLAPRHLHAEVDAYRTARWRHVRANYGNATFGDVSDGARQPDLARPADRAVLAANAAVYAGACKDAGMRGLWLDTEQYARYANGGAPFPLGKDQPDVLRSFGAEWIRAVQSRFPEVRVIITFAWSPDTRIAAFLKGVAPFLDGILAGIRAPGRIVHGYENSFYYGWGPGNPYAAQGYDGSRERFRRMRLGQWDWRKHAANPARYDQFVEVWHGLPIDTGRPRFILSRNRPRGSCRKSKP